MKDDATILDVCCGGRMFYFDKNDPRVLFQDIREESMTLCDGRSRSSLTSSAIFAAWRLPMALSPLWYLTRRTSYAA